MSKGLEEAHSTFMGDFEWFKTAGEEVIADVVEKARELDLGA